jgi:DNA (cytosine-5)-methyltransferase 1
MRHGSLFSGIGGFDLASEWMGWENAFHCEWNPFGQRVLKHYWPNAESFNDITKTDFTKYYGTIDLISGGFPCQPYSSAGKRLGKEDERHLWPEMCRAIREVAPRYVVGENVRGLTNWNGGVVFDEVCTDLENLGYQVAPYLIPASAVNAPHKRERIWFVAWNTKSDGTSAFRKVSAKRQGNQSSSDTERIDSIAGTDGKISNVAYSESVGNRREERNSGPGEISCARFGGSVFNKPDDNGKTWDVTDTKSFGGLRFGNRPREEQFGRGDWSGFPTQSPICSGDDGFPSELDGITFPKWRAESIKAYGNAIVPQVAYQIFKSIQDYENLL